jgi:hypothetical protein
MTVSTAFGRLDSFVPVAARHLLVTCVFVWALIGSPTYTMCSGHFLSTPVTHRVPLCHIYTRCYRANNKHGNMTHHCGGRVRVQGSVCGMFNGREALKRVCLCRVCCHSNIVPDLYRRRSSTRALAALLNEVQIKEIHSFKSPLV